MVIDQLGVLESAVLGLITEKVFTKEAVQYLTRRVNEILAQPRVTRRDEADQELEQARQDLENIKSAIRQGLITATTKAMLEETEARVARAEERSCGRPTTRIETWSSCQD